MLKQADIENRIDSSKRKTRSEAPFNLTGTSRQSLHPAIEKMERLSESACALMRRLTRTKFDHYFAVRGANMHHDIEELWATSDDLGDPRSHLYMLDLPPFIPKLNEQVEIIDEPLPLSDNALRMIHAAGQAKTGFISLASTCHCLREALFTEFPLQRFIVRGQRRHNGEDNFIVVHWIDGPTAPEVEEIACYFVGRGEPSALGYRSYIHRLVRERYVQFENSSIRLTRDFSREALMSVAETLCAQYDRPPLNFVSWRTGGGYVTDPTCFIVRDDNGRYTLPELVFKSLNEISLYRDIHSAKNDLRGVVQNATMPDGRTLNYYVKNQWTWIGFSVKPSQFLIEIFERSGASWSSRKNMFYWRRQISLEAIQEMILAGEK